MKIKHRAVIGLMVFSFGAAAHATPFVDFESPTYTVDTDIHGVDGWSRFNSPTTLVTPGTVPVVLAGSQSVAIINPGLYRRAIQLPAGPLPTLITLQWLMQGPSGATAQIYPSDALGFSTPIGMDTGGGTFNMFGSASDSSTGTAVVAGDTYLVEMVINFTNPQPSFQGFATDLTAATARTLLGTGTSALSFSPAAFFQNPNGGLFIGKSAGGNVYYDNFEVIPEPASLGLLALGAIVTLRRRNRC